MTSTPAHEPAPDGAWVRQTTDKPGSHECKPPVREVRMRIPSAALTADRSENPPAEVSFGMRADGEDGDLWRCQCGRLWAVNHDGGRDVRGGYVPSVWEWRRASAWQRLRSVRR